MREEILLVGGRVYLEPHLPPAEAVLVREGRVAAVGSSTEVAAEAEKGVRRVDLQGTTVTAGFVDSHVHLTSWALMRRRVSLAGSETIEEAVERVRRAVPDGVGWVRGHGWNRHLWQRDPDRRDLKAVGEGVAVFLDSQDLHSAWLNAEALRRCGIGRDTPDPAGGRIVRDESGEPTGVLLENARSFALARVPEPSSEAIRSALLAAQAAAHRLGLTGVHSVEATGLRDFTALEVGGELKLRVLQHIQLDQLDAAIAVGIRSGFGSNHLRVGGVKMFLDGALGSRTAWMREPYEGAPDNRGINTLPPQVFEEAVRRAASNGFASTIHAIGDAAVELAVDVLSRVEPPPALQHRIEHLQLCPPELWERVASAGIIASMQPVHLLDDVVPAEKHWGRERSRGAYAFRALEEAGVVLALGSDVPVATLDPRPGLFAARRRTGWDEYTSGEGSADEWFPEHALTGERAVAGYTVGPAVASGDGARRGRLRPGYDADLVVWSEDPITAPPGAYSRMTALLTIVDGHIVHDLLTDDS